MPLATPSVSDPDRLERLWAGEFGDTYTERNDEAGADRGDFWYALAGILGVETDTCLEIGCNVGANLRHLRRYYECAGLDINREALRRLEARYPDVGIVEGSARALPFPDASFDLVLTCGVLIHQDEESLRRAMYEMVRVSRRWVLAAEYFRPVRAELPYRGGAGTLWGDDYGRRFREAFPGLLALRDGGWLRPEDGFDSLTWWLFEKLDHAGTL